MLVNDFTNVSKILHAFKNCENCVFFLMFFLGILIFFVMCLIVVCDDLVMSGVFPVEDFNRYVVVTVEETALMCWGMTLHEFVLETLLAILYEEFLILSWDFTWEFFWDDMWNHVHLYLYLYIYINI